MVTLHHLYLLKIANRIKGRVTEQTANLAVIALHLKPFQEIVQRIRHCIGIRNRQLLRVIIRIAHGTHSAVNAYAGNGTEGDKRKTVLVGMKIRAFQQGRLRIHIPHLQVNAHRRM